VSRIVLVWTIAYVVARPWADLGDAAVAAAIAAGVWALLLQWMTQVFRTMTFAAGPFARSGAAAALGVVALSTICFWTSILPYDPSSLALLGLTTFIAVGIWDSIVERAARVPYRAVIVGDGVAAERLRKDLERDPSANVEVVGVVNEHDPFSRRTTANLAGTVREKSPDLVVVAVTRGRPDVFEQLLSVADAGFQMVGLPEMYEFAFGRLPVEELTSAWFMSVLHAYHRTTNRFAKRAFDVVVALLGVIVVLPLIPIIVFVVKRTPGALLYRQTRLGEQGSTFTMLKFRSMQSNAEALGAVWAATNDSRIIPGGQFLRRLRLDELPQLWNVLRGEMSIVGPRPERPEFVEHLESEVPFWTQRHLLKPGITGWAQIRAPYAADALGTAEKLSYDLWYLRHRSIVLDALICLRTIPRMISFGGAR
jgi:exopolysaccharide biosynthesis polyprenyl glycosylphosphotransferase